MMKMNNPLRTPTDPWLSMLKDQNINLYREFLLGSTNFDGMSKALFIYCNDDLDSEILARLFKNNSSKQIIDQVLTHDKCPLDLIRNIIDKKEEKFIIGDYVGDLSIAKRNDLTLTDIKLLLDSADESVKQILAVNKNLDGELIKILATDSNYYVRRNVAERNDISDAIIEGFVHDEESFVRRQIAQNKNLTKDQIKILLNDSDTRVREDLALNEILSASELMQISKDKDIKVLLNLSQRKDLTEDILEEIINNYEIKISKIKFEEETDDLKSLLNLILSILTNERISSNNLVRITVFLIRIRFFDFEFSWLDLRSLKSDIKQSMLSNSMLPEEIKVEFALLGHTINPSNLNNSLQNTSAEDELFDSNFQADDYSKLSSQIFRFGLDSQNGDEIVNKFVKIFGELGHPLGLLHPLTNLNPEIKYELGPTYTEWVSHEIIYRTLWPEIYQRKDAKFLIKSSSFGGDHTYFYVNGLWVGRESYEPADLRTNGLDFPFINEWGEYRNWIVDSEDLDFDEAFASLDFDEYLLLNRVDIEEEVLDEQTYEYLVAIAIKKYSDDLEITSKGKNFVIDAADGIPLDERVTEAEIILDECQVYGWSKLDIGKQNMITNITIQGLQSRSDDLKDLSEYFLMCIALIPNLDVTIKKILEGLDIELINKALTKSHS
jgi:hypothetical protein